tara:strand:+ start:1521 stop:2423 length:903 start_codon:yes stop_codon:yes gene_type:complete
MFFRKKSRPKIKFFNIIPGVSTLYPVTKSSELNRDWIAYEKKEHNERISKCPIKRFSGALNPTGWSDMPSELSGLLGAVQADDRRQQKQSTSIGKCPAINSIMHNGFIIYAPADFSVYAENKETLETYHDETFPPADSVYTAKNYLEYHGPGHAKWLKDSTKDSTNDTIIKVNTMWNIICDDDIAFIQLKVPYAKETRFSAVTGVLDPVLSPEINLQLWWHVNDGSEVTIKAGTPLAMYLPISKKMLEYDAIIGDATDDDISMMKEYHYLLSQQFSENRNPAKKAKKIFQKYLSKWRKSE